MSELRKIVAQGVLSKMDETDISTLVQEYVYHLRMIASGNAAFDTEGQVIDNNFERAKLTREKVKAQVRDNLVAGGVLVNVDEMSGRLAGGIQAAKSILRTIPSQLKTELGMDVEASLLASDIVDRALLAVAKSWGADPTMDQYKFSKSSKKLVRKRPGQVRALARNRRKKMAAEKL
jgi:phosphotransacetylase